MSENLRLLRYDYLPFEFLTNYILLGKKKILQIDQHILYMHNYDALMQERSLTKHTICGI